MFLEAKKDGEQTTKTLEPWRQLLLDAADYMERHGHCAGRAVDDCGAVCLVGAITSVTWDRAVEDFALNRMDVFCGGHGTCVAFSDTHTGPEVIAAMRACAKS